MRAANDTAAWEIRMPGSSIRQATPPTGMCVRTPVLSITTKAPSSTSTLPFSRNKIERRSFIGIGRSGGKGRSFMPV
ncbi:MAG: hypothetical protein SF066_11870 [Thermoanaerobaculia bacterium]|nr:hypothetical protein [Thermoanaerobaculia bacterium]